MNFTSEAQTIVAISCNDPDRIEMLLCKEAKNLCIYPHMCDRYITELEAVYHKEAAELIGDRMYSPFDYTTAQRVLATALVRSALYDSIVKELENES